MSNKGSTALARRLYLHVLHGSHVTADDMSRLVAAMEKKDQDIDRLREWIAEEGKRNDTCTYNSLREVCDGCKCGRTK